MFNGRSIPSASSVAGILLGITALPKWQQSSGKALPLTWGLLLLIHSPPVLTPGSTFQLCQCPPWKICLSPCPAARAVTTPELRHSWKCYKMQFKTDPWKAWKCCFLINSSPVWKRYFSFSFPSLWGHQLLKSHLFSARSPEIILNKDKSLWVL